MLRIDMLRIEMVYIALVGYTVCVLFAGGFVAWRIFLRRMRKAEDFQMRFASIVQRAMAMYEGEEWHEDETDGKIRVVARYSGGYSYGNDADEVRRASAHRVAHSAMLSLTTGKDRYYSEVPASTVSPMARLSRALLPDFCDILAPHDMHSYKQILRNRLAKEKS